MKWSHGPVVKGRTFLAGRSWNAGSNHGVRLPVFFSFIVFLPFGFLLFILTADPVSFARFLRKRISSYSVPINISFIRSGQGFWVPGFGYTVSRAILIQVYGIFWSTFRYKVFSFSYARDKLLAPRNNQT